MKPVVWTIAGSDPSGGAGIQADTKTFADLGVQGCSVIAALTAQSVQRVQAVQAVSPDMLAAQWQALADSHPPLAIKTGMLHGAAQVQQLARWLQAMPGVPVVCDPVWRASDGAALQEDAAREILLRELLPRITLLTPNLPEARWLLGSGVAADADVPMLARALLGTGVKAVLLKGGHGDACAGMSCDFFSDGNDAFWMTHRRLPGHIHGSGCILSAAITAALARGYALDDAVVLGRRYLQQGWRLAAGEAAAGGWFMHAGWPTDPDDIPAVSSQPAMPASVAFPGMGFTPVGLYPVVDSADWIRRLLPLGISTIQLRIKQGPAALIRREVAEAVALGRHYGARVFINDEWQLALESGAWGVHLGQEDLDTADLAALRRAGIRLGISNHSEREIARAHALQPSYMALGPIFETTTKVMRFAPQGLERLQAWVRLLGGRYPLVAIGGIDEASVAPVLSTGVGNIAVVRAITASADPIAATRRLGRQLAAGG